MELNNPNLSKWVRASWNISTQGVTERYLKRLKEAEENFARGVGRVSNEGDASQENDKKCPWCGVEGTITNIRGVRVCGGCGHPR
jgi:hypothetical protein